MSSFVFIVVTIIAIVPLISVFQLTSIKLLAGKLSIIDAGKVPREQIEHLIAGERFVIQHGFVRQANVTRGPVISGQPWGVYGAVYFQEESNTWAFIYVEPILHAVFSWRLLFITPQANNGCIATTSGSEFGKYSEYSGVRKVATKCFFYFI